MLKYIGGKAKRIYFSNAPRRHRKKKKRIVEHIEPVSIWKKLYTKLLLQARPND